MSGGNQTYNPRSLETIVGTMFSGKSKELLERGKRAQEYGDVRTYYFKPETDTRDDTISSRNGLSLESELVNIVGESTQILDILKKQGGELDSYGGLGLVLIDEAQFFDKNLEFVAQILTKKGYNVVVAGLHKDFRGQVFGPMGQLMALSDYTIKKLFPVCYVEGCVDDGELPQRLRNGKPDSALSDTIIIEGSSDEVDYRPVCRIHHKVPDLEDYLQKKFKASLTQ